MYIFAVIVILYHHINNVINQSWAFQEHEEITVLTVTVFPLILIRGHLFDVKDCT
jgi:hypothetical protein